MLCNTPETIVERFPSLQLADVYAVIASYLRHKMEVDAYLGRRQQEAAEMRAKVEATQKDRQLIRKRLLKRATEKQKEVLAA